MLRYIITSMSMSCWCCSFTFTCTNVTPQTTAAGCLLVGQTDIFFVADNAINESAYMQTR